MLSSSNCPLPWLGGGRDRSSLLNARSSALPPLAAGPAGAAAPASACPCRACSCLPSILALRSPAAGRVGGARGCSRAGQAGWPHGDGAVAAPLRGGAACLLPHPAGNALSCSPRWQGRCRPAPVLSGDPRKAGIAARAAPALPVALHAPASAHGRVPRNRVEPAGNGAAPTTSLLAGGGGAVRWRAPHRAARPAPPSAGGGGVKMHARLHFTVQACGRTTQRAAGLTAAPRPPPAPLPLSPPAGCTAPPSAGCQAGAARRWSCA